jgi:phage baseplate assembly protein V
MMGHMLNQMRQQALGVANGIDQLRVGTIQSYNPDTYSCTVLLQPSGVITGWLPILSPWVGNGWGMFCPPGPGVAVSVIPREGMLDAAFILPGFFNDVERPISVPQGEFWLVHASGASFKLTNDGTVDFSDGNGATITLDGAGAVSTAGTWSHDGDMSVSGGMAVKSGMSVTGDVGVAGNLTVDGQITGGPFLTQ